MTKLRHGEISSFAKLDRVAELISDLSSMAPELAFWTIQLCCLSYHFTERVDDSLLKIQWQYCCYLILFKVVCTCMCVCLLLSLRLTMMPATESSCVPGAASVPRACSHPRRRAVTPHACEGADAERLSLPHQAGLQGQCWTWFSDSKVRDCLISPVKGLSVWSRSKVSVNEVATL